MKAHIERHGTILRTQFIDYDKPGKFVRLFGKEIWQMLEGKKVWDKQSMRLETSYSINNERRIRAALEERGFLERPLGDDDGPSGVHGALGTKLKPFQYQEDAFVKLGNRKHVAFFAEQGLGKTKMLIDWVRRWYIDGKVKAVLVVAPKGVHTQWVEQQFPANWPDDEPPMMYAWDGKGKLFFKKKGKKPDEAPLFDGKEEPDHLGVFSVNYDALRSEKGNLLIQAFTKRWGSRGAIIFDESHELKNARSERHKFWYKIAQEFEYRAISTGTPIAKDPVDEWAQFKVLNEAILGYRYVTHFRNEFCLMGGYMGKQVIGVRNAEKLNKLVSDHTFRITKKEGLDLPDKIYDEVAFSMDEQQRKLHSKLRRQLLVQLDTGDWVDGVNPAVLFTRLQQVSCGYAVTEEGKVHRINNPRMDAMKRILDATPEKKFVIWARFKEDIKWIAEELGEACVTVDGSVSASERQKRKDAFIMLPQIQYFVANPQAAGTGIDGLQTVCDSVIYYSNSFRALDRWQSEDRIHRIGMKGAMYYDLIATGSVDRHILRNLRGKRDIASITLDEARTMLEEL
jgi:SNF2 family DNA or RNA helicase